MNIGPTRTTATPQTNEKHHIHDSIFPTKILNNQYVGTEYFRKRTKKALEENIIYLKKLGATPVHRDTLITSGDILVAIRNDIMDHGYFLLINNIQKNNEITNAGILDLAGREGDPIERYGYLELSGRLYSMQLLQCSADELLKFNKVLSKSTADIPNFYLIKKNICNHNDIKVIAKECAIKLTNSDEKLFVNFRGIYSRFYNCNHFVYNVIKGLYNHTRPAIKSAPL
jgi:hypothetical protein